VQFNSFFFFSGLNDLSIDERRLLESPLTVILKPISPFRSNSVCFIKLGVPSLGTYRFTFIISSY
jgi:hypothetical protein